MTLIFGSPEARQIMNADKHFDELQEIKERLKQAEAEIHFHENELGYWENERQRLRTQRRRLLEGMT